MERHSIRNYAETVPFPKISALTVFFVVIVNSYHLAKRFRDTTSEFYKIAAPSDGHKSKKTQQLRGGLKNCALDSTWRCVGQNILDLFCMIFSVATISEDSEEELPIWMRKASLEEKKGVSETRGMADEPMPVNTFNQ